MAEENMQQERSEFMEHMQAAARAYKKQWASLIPQAFWRYRREAKREFLLGMQALVDGALERVERAGNDMEAAGRGKQKVEVEVE